MRGTVSLPEMWATSRSLCASALFQLPLALENHALDLAPHHVALERGEMVDVELAVEMIDLVLEGARQQVFGGLLVPVSVRVLRLDGDPLAARKVLAKVWNGEASFAAGLL